MNLGRFQPGVAPRQVDGGRTVAAVEHDVGLSDYSGRRILLVEDEPMISMMLADMLNESGHEVDGPHATVKDAVLAATKNELQGGILDVNVRGEKVYAVADLLISRPERATNRLSLSMQAARMSSSAALSAALKEAGPRRRPLTEGSR